MLNINDQSNCDICKDGWFWWVKSLIIWPMQYKSLLCTFLATATWCNGQVPVPLSLPDHSILCICCRDDVPAYPCVQKTENITKQYNLADFGTHWYILYMSVYSVYGFTVDSFLLCLIKMINLILRQYWLNSIYQIGDAFQTCLDNNIDY